ncbi:glycosyltransferase [Stutzerimonas degradans]
MKIIFIGHFSNSKAAQPGASAAGDAVQQKIVRTLKQDSAIDLLSISQPPARSWPKGRLFFSNSQDSYALFPCLINVAFLRDVWFGLVCMKYIIKNKPHKVLQYNSYLFVNIFVIFASAIVGAKAIIIIQDYRVGSGFKVLAKVHDRIAGFFVRFYDFAIPVTEALAKKLKIKSDRLLVFPGAMEHDAPLINQDKVSSNKDAEITVLYAGALEKHNGLDRLLSSWEKVPENVKLFIYGRGSLGEEVLRAAQKLNNIQYLGFSSKDEIHRHMLKSDFNVCLRFSNGLDERFFFPSKFFSINCYPGFSLVNDFYGLPDGYRDAGLIINDDFSNILEILQCDKKYLRLTTAERQGYLYENYVWSKLLGGVVVNG